MARFRSLIGSFFLAILCMTAGHGVAADGIQDNIPENVRRIPELGVDVPADRAATMRAQIRVLQDKIAAVRETKDATKIALLPDVMIFERAVRCALDYQEFFDVKEFDKADALLVEGIKRADQLLAGKPEWITQKGLVVRGYISRIDNTVQPYGLVIPPTYAIDHSVPSRCDIWFHGRGEKLSEVNFLWDRMKNPGEFTPDHTIMLHPYGRYCNAFKFAGEVDVLEALEHVQKHYRIDEDRISVRGFSMGGAACWQFATHYADRWFAANPGAGFSETPQFLKVFQKEELKPTPWEQTLWNLYDCDKWAINLTHCPTIAYSGENDSQKQAADVMEKALAEQDFKVRLKHLVGKGMGHKYDSGSKLQVEDSLQALARLDRDPTPNPQHFATYSLKYNQANWITVHGIEEHWKKAKITGMFKEDAKNLSDDQIAEGPNSLPDLGFPTVFLLVKNVSDLEVSLPADQTLIAPETGHVRIVVQEFIDGPDAATPELGMKMINEAKLSAPGPYSDRSWSIRIAKRRTGETKSDLVEHSNSRIENLSTFPALGQLDEDSGWSIVTADPPGLRKRNNLQGPIDDAFMDSFIFVRPTGTAANEAVGKWAEAELTRAIEHWRRHFRGDARVVNDVDLTDEMIQSSNIVLWGDPKSNSVLAKIADKLPIQWTSDNITVKDKTYDAKTQAPILIYPNPLNQNRYVVLNSSFTFRDYAYLNNARQVPMLPDWAIIDLTTPPNAVWPGKVVDANFFDEQWKLK